MKIYESKWYLNNLASNHTTLSKVNFMNRLDYVTLIVGRNEVDKFDFHNFMITKASFEIINWFVKGILVCLADPKWT